MIRSNSQHFIDFYIFWIDKDTKCTYERSKETSTEYKWAKHLILWQTKPSIHLGFSIRNKSPINRFHKLKLIERYSKLHHRQLSFASMCTIKNRKIINSFTNKSCSKTNCFFCFKSQWIISSSYHMTKSIIDFKHLPIYRKVPPTFLRIIFITEIG